MKKILFFISLWLAMTSPVASQGFLHAEGKTILSDPGEEVILRGIGTGNWMLQEGYMMQSSDVAPTQHEFRDKLIETIGTENTDSFYNAWLAWHFTRADVDSMKAWGFNSVRAALHYKWFTLPVEEEPVPGEQTWLDKGFIMLDSLLDWCGDNQMYLILDMHGTPGGQGTDAAISDYDDTKPSLWESQDNRDKLVALWRKLAERYSNELWIGGYDLINEPNWDFGQSTHPPLWAILQDITTAIREVDQNHMIIIEGNWFANDYNGVPSPWDDNLVFSFHKYWTYTTPSTLSWIVNLRDTYNVPIWLGESGENSNTWYTGLISSCESLNIGWSWWPVKKSGINNPLRVLTNEDYTQLIESWSGGGSMPSAEEAFEAVLKYAENHKIENCIIQQDVIDAMIRQPHTTATLPFRKHVTGQPVFAVDYDLGRNNYAYFDTDTANYRLDQNDVFTNWNQGWAYRNDGVDIEACTDTDESNGYNVGWTADGEWLLYTLATDSAAAYTLSVRYAAGGSGAVVRFESDGSPATGNINLPGTGGWQNWRTLEVEDVVLPAGTQSLKFVFEKGGANINYFRLDNPVSLAETDFKAVYAETDAEGSSVYLFLNKEVSGSDEDIAESEFILLSGQAEIAISNVVSEAPDKRILALILNEPVYYGNSILLSYNGSSVQSDTFHLKPFTEMEVGNLLPVRYALPGRIEAEDFFYNNGFELETCTDGGNGFNTAYASAGDYLDYRVYLPAGGTYHVNYRVATIRTDAELMFLTDAGGGFVALDTIRFTPTGAWQTYQTQSAVIQLEEGRYTVRLQVKQSEHNLNWFEVAEYSGLSEEREFNNIRIYPNPASGRFTILFPEALTGSVHISLYTMAGELILTDQIFLSSNEATMDISDFQDGLYILRVSSAGWSYSPVRLMKG